MQLLTHDLLNSLDSTPVTPVGERKSTLPAVPLPMSPGLSAADLVLLFVPPCDDRWEASIHHVIRTSGLTTYPIPLNAPREAWQHACKRSRAVAVVTESGSSSNHLPSETIWRVAWAEGAGKRTVIFPLFRRQPRDDRFLTSGEFSRHPYAGLSRSVGDIFDSLWVVPAGEPSTSRNAVNLEYWIGHRY